MAGAAAERSIAVAAMADFVVLRAAAEDAMARALEQVLGERAANEAAELCATLVIQRQLRRSMAVRRYKQQRHSCSEMARVHRGFLARRRCHQARARRAEREALAVFHYYASAIQHVYRGFYSRKYSHDFYARKAYIEHIVETSNQLRVQLAANRETAAVEEQRRRAADTQTEFKRVAQRLHHLLSTKASPGVYNSPYAVDGPPTAFGVPVEQHLRNCTTDLLRLRGLKAADVERQRIKRSVQSGTAYGAHKEHERVEARRARTMRVSERNFQAGGKGPLKGEPVAGISVNTEYIEPSKVGLSSRALATSAQANGAPRFRTALPHNQLFDEIHDEAAAATSRSSY